MSSENSGDSKGSANLRPWKAGESGNPGGRPKKLAELSIKIQEMDEKHRARLEMIADEGEHKDSIAAIKLLWAYAYGNPTQAITGADGVALVDFAALVEKFRKAADG